MNLTYHDTVFFFFLIYKFFIDTIHGSTKNKKSKTKI